MPDRYYVLKDSEFQLVYNATDPEGYPMSYSYMANKNSSISLNENRKLLNISLSESQNMTLKVSDYGDLETMHAVEIVTIPCDCQNGGSNNQNFFVLFLN